jgi:hypothetical protein
MTMLVAAVRESGSGTKRKRPHVRYSVAIEGKADIVAQGPETTRMTHFDISRSPFTAPHSCP